jgi:hypothetical protein
MAASVLAPAAISSVSIDEMNRIVVNHTSATLATIMVATFIEMSRYPMTPRTARTGSRFEQWWHPEPKRAKYEKDHAEDCEKCGAEAAEL